MRKIAIIPARYQSSRFPGKPLALILNKPMIQHVYERVLKTDEINEVYVATDDTRIYDCVIAFGGKAIMTSTTHTCGTDRLKECVDILKLDDDDIIINIQGDEPLINKNIVKDLIHIFDDDKTYMGTLKIQIKDQSELSNYNVVKVICDKNNDAIYFSRLPIPFNRDDEKIIYYKHVGVYGYRKWFLVKFSQMNRTMLEKSESLEQLRIIENGFKIKVLETSFYTIGVDTPEQLNEVINRMESEKYE